MLGVVPVLVDAGEDSGNVTPATVAARITERTRAIAVTHLFGYSVDLAGLRALAALHGLAVLEDCSHAHGATCDGVPVGSVGDVSVFSVGGLKMVSGGMGGVVAFRDPAAYEIACLFTSFRQRPRASVHDPALRAFADVGLGGNLRISPIAALLASSHLRRLPELVAVKDTQARAIAAAAELPGVAGVAVSERGSMGGWYDLVVRLCPQAAPRPGAWIDALRACGLPVKVPQTTAPLSRTPVFRGSRPAGWRAYQDDPRWFEHAGNTGGWLAHDLHDRWVSLPATRLNTEQPRFVEQVCAILRASADTLTPPTLSGAAYPPPRAGTPSRCPRVARVLGTALCAAR